MLDEVADAGLSLQVAVGHITPQADLVRLVAVVILLVCQQAGHPPQKVLQQDKRVSLRFAGKRVARQCQHGMSCTRTGNWAEGERSSTDVAGVA